MRKRLNYARGAGIVTAFGGLLLAASSCGPAGSQDQLTENVKSVSNAVCPTKFFPNACANSLWPADAGGPLGVIPYAFDPSVPQGQIDAIVAGINYWKALLGGRITFREVGEGDMKSVLFTRLGDNGNACGSSARDEFPQVHFGANCSLGQNLYHELGHLIAFEHTYERADRDRYLRLPEYSPCSNGIARCFDNSPTPPTLGNGPGGTFGVFDKTSIMIYSSMPDWAHSTTCELHEPNGGGYRPADGGNCVYEDIIANAPGACPDCCRGYVLRDVTTPASPPFCPADVQLPSDVSASDVAGALEAYATKADWAPFESLGKDISPTKPLQFELQAGVYTKGTPAIASLSTNQTVMVTRGTDTLNRLYYAIYTGTGAATWTVIDPPPSSTLAGDPTVVSWSQSSSHFDIAVVTTTGGSKKVWTRAYDNGTFGAWRGLASPSGAISTGVALASWGENRLDLFVNGTDGRLWHTCASCSSSVTWDNPGGTLMGGQSSAPAAASGTANRIDVVVASGGALWQLTINGSTAGSWLKIRSATATPALVGTPALASAGPSHLDVFMKTDNEHLFHGSCSFGGCTTLNQWGHWEDLGGILKSSPAASSSLTFSRIDVLAASKDGSALPVPTSDLGLWHKWWPWGKGKRERVTPLTARSSVHGDIDGDGISDILMTSGTGWASIPAAISKVDMSFSPFAYELQYFPTWAQSAGSKPVAGDFNGDGRSDVALVGGQGFDAVPIAVSNGDGSFSVLPLISIPVFTNLAQIAGVKAVSGDFNGDGRDDIALVGGPGWTSIVVAFSNGDGNFRLTNTANAAFGGFASASGAKAVSGDFNGDGWSDIALVGGPWSDIKVAYSAGGNGNFVNSPGAIATFPSWAQTAGATPVSGDFNGDGRSDIALVGGTGWTTMPLALANSDGSFTAKNASNADFPALTRVSGAKPVSGDFNGDGRGDIALVGGAGWNMAPVALSNGDGTFTPNWPFTSYYPEWSRTAGALPASY